MAGSTLDLVVIGAGPGGYVAAVHAARLGMDVACVEQSELGGTCLNVGCIPSKALLESSELYYRMVRGLDHHGVGTRGLTLDLDAMMARKQKIVGTMVKGIGSLFQSHKVRHVQGQASLAAPGRVRVRGSEGEQELRTRRVLLATGSVPVELKGMPFDRERIISSTEALALLEVPRRLAVIGAGAIGLELGSVWNRLGADVVIVEYMKQILPGMDTEMAGQLQRLLKRQKIAIHLQTAARGATVDADGVTLTVATGDDEKAIECDRLLVAVGRKAFTGGLGLDQAGVAQDAQGRVLVNQQYETSVSGVYAIGDVIAGPMLAHKAEAEGIAAVERMAGRAGSVNYDAVPSVVYTHPELASVGLTEEAAREQVGSPRIGKYQFRANARAHCMDSIDGLVKLVCDPRTDRLLGAHILGPQASSLIAEAVLALEFGASAEDVARTVHAHPALSEVVKEAAWDVHA